MTQKDRIVLADMSEQVDRIIAVPTIEQRATKTIAQIMKTKSLEIQRNGAFEDGPNHWTNGSDNDGHNKSAHIRIIMAMHNNA